MEKQEYVVRNGKLFLVSSDCETECSKEELTNIIKKQDENEAEVLNKNEHLIKANSVLKDKIELSKDILSKREQIANSVLNGILSCGPKEYRLNMYSNHYTHLREEVIKEVFIITDEFLRQSEKFKDD